MNAFLRQQKLFTFQPALGHQYSCLTVLIHLVDDWLSSIDSGQYVGAVFNLVVTLFSCITVSFGTE